MEQLYDMVSLVFAVPFQVALLIGGMALIFHDWKKFAFSCAVVFVSSIGLYFFWFKNLKSDEETFREDEYFDKISADILDGETDIYDADVTLAEYKAMKREEQKEQTESVSEEDTAREMMDSLEEVQAAAAEAKAAAAEARAEAAEARATVEQTKEAADRTREAAETLEANAAESNALREKSDEDDEETT
jgi:hypothetical protein